MTRQGSEDKKPFVAAIHAPDPPGRISGRCTDATGRALEGVRIDVLDADGIVVDTQSTGRDGRFTTRLLFAGQYRIQVRTGRQVVDSKPCSVLLGQVTRVDFRLRL